MAGSVDGVEKCAYINATADDLVECEEEFMVVLAQLTHGESINLGNNITAVTLIDGDGMLQTFLFLNAPNLLYPLHFVAASFSVDTVATVVEGETLMACVEMTSAAATLHNDVVVSLSTLEDTGRQFSSHSLISQSLPFPYCSNCWQ